MFLVSEEKIHRQPLKRAIAIKCLSLAPSGTVVGRSRETGRLFRAFTGPALRLTSSAEADVLSNACVTDSTAGRLGKHHVQRYHLSTDVVVVVVVAGPSGWHDRTTLDEPFGPP